MWVEYIPDKNASIKTMTPTILLCTNVHTYIRECVYVCVKKKWQKWWAYNSQMIILQMHNTHTHP